MLHAPLLLFSILAEADSGVLQLTPVQLFTMGGGLVSAIVFLFLRQNASEEKRVAMLVKQNEDTLKHHDTFVSKSEAERKQAESDRKEYIARLEHLMQTIAQDRILLGEQIVKTQAANTEALTCNTRARESAAHEMEKLMKEVSGAVIMKLAELGFLIPPKAQLPKKSPPKRHAVRKPPVPSATSRRE